jgi:hypothetical protein
MSNDPSFDQKQEARLQALLRLKRYERPAEGHEALAEQTIAAFHQQALHRARTLTLGQLLMEKWRALRPLTALSLVATPLLLGGLLTLWLWPTQPTGPAATASSTPSTRHNVEIISSGPLIPSAEKRPTSVQPASEQKNQPTTPKPAPSPTASEATSEDGNIIIVR